MPAYDSRTALLVVDVQHDFADAVGSLYVRGAEEIIPLVNDEVASAVDAGALVVYSQDWHPESTPHNAMAVAVQAMVFEEVSLIRDGPIA